MNSNPARPHPVNRVASVGARPRAPLYLLGALSIAFCPAMAQAPDEPAAGALAPVAVTASRTPLRVDETIAEVTVIDRARIEEAAGRTLPELLARQAGVQFSSNGGLGKASSVYLRGMEARHTLLLVDGVRYNSATTGTPSWENIPLEQIERIEIVRGPMSGLYGSEAAGGVVQIFTRRGTEGVHPSGSVSIGSNHYAQPGGGLRFGQGAFDGAVQVDRTVTRGFSATNKRVQFGNYNPDNDGFRQSAASAQFGMKLGASWRADVRLLQSEGESQYDDGPGVDSRARLRSVVQALELGGPVNDSWRSALRVAQTKDIYDTLSSASSAPGTIATEQQQVTWENNVATPLGVAVVLVENLQQKVSRPGAAFSVSNRSINALALGLDGQRGAHIWQASLRNDRNSQYGSQTNGTLGYGYVITSAWRVGASYGTSFVAPSFNQLYYPGFGSPDLQPEEGKQGELSIRWAAAGQQLRAAYFDNRIRGYISSGPQPTNIPRTRINGVTVSYEARVSDWTLAASIDHLDPRNVTEGSPDQGRQLPRRSRNALKIAADRDLGEWRLGGSFNAFSNRFDDPANKLRVGGYGTLDLRADWRIARQWSMGFRLNNIADKRYETVYGYNEPGREIFATLSYRGI